MASSITIIDTEEKKLHDKFLAKQIKNLKNGIDIIEMASRLKVYRESLLFCYLNCILHHGLTPLEELPDNYKKEIWQETKKNTGGLGKKECVEMSKIVYMLNEKLEG